MSTASEVLRSRINDSGLSHTEIQDGCGVSQTTISRFMRGDGGMTISSMEKILAFLVTVKVSPRKVVVRKPKAVKVGA